MLTDDIAARYCNDCEKDVHWVATFAEYWEKMNNSQCMCFDSEFLAHSHAGEYREYLTKELDRQPTRLIGAVVLRDDNKVDISNSSKGESRSMLDQIKSRMKRP